MKAFDWPGAPLPAWVSNLRDTQVEAANNALDAFKRGVDVVVLDAPVGAGKTLIAEMVRRCLGDIKGTYICHGKSLQAQFLGDYDYARVLMGRANYPTTKFPRTLITGADCKGRSCTYCDPRSECPYMRAKKAAIGAEVAVLNTAYMLSFRSPTFVRGLVVVDECDTLEGELMRHLEFRVSEKRMRVLGVTGPIKGARQTTVAKWLRGEFKDAVKGYRELLKPVDPADLQACRLDEQCGKELGELGFVAGELEEGGWVRDYSYNKTDLILKPVTVGRQGAKMLWSRGMGSGDGFGVPTKWLCMSGTVISGQEWADSVGVEEAGLEWEVVSVPMTFDKKNRPVVLKPVADMSKKGMEDGTALAKTVEVIAGLVKRHVGENMLVHTVSYALMRDLVAGLRGKGLQNVISYEHAGDRDIALSRFRESGGVIVAPSLDRGVDLPGDLCRVVVVAKLPFPYLGDRQVNERLHMPGGNMWYAVQTARSLVQMTGRGVRHEDDWCRTYILDRQFGRWWGQWGRQLLPKWFRDAIQGDE